MAWLVFTNMAIAQSTRGTQTIPPFEVASIKPCRADAPGQRSGANGTEGEAGRLRLNCQSVADLVRMAYVLFDGGHVNPAATEQVSGGPKWIESERYTILAKAETTKGPLPSPGMMRGPMLQRLLEDRFKLKIRQQVVQVHVYELVPAKGGHKLEPFQTGTCNPMDLTVFPPREIENPCPSLGEQKGPNVSIEAKGTTVPDFIKFFLRGLDRPVIDKTGLTGRFNFRLVYAPDADSSREPSPQATLSDPAGPAIFTALREQLGLELKSADGPSETLVIDHIERPTTN
jgi:uncharacterized protein (TIGR03435 family)